MGRIIVCTTSWGEVISDRLYATWCRYNVPPAIKRGRDMSDTSPKTTDVDDKVKKIVLKALCIKHGRSDLTEKTSLTDPIPKGLGLDGPTLKGIYYAIEPALVANSYPLNNLIPESFLTAKTISDVVKLVLKDLGGKS
jgi:hypothetical protein